MRQAVLGCATQSTRDYHTVREADHQAAVDGHQRRSAALLELPPELVGAPHQRNVERVLEVGLADDAAIAVRRAEGVSLRELIEAEHTPAAQSELAKRSASHRAEPQDNRVVPLMVGHQVIVGNLAVTPQWW